MLVVKNYGAQKIYCPRQETESEPTSVGGVESDLSKVRESTAITLTRISQTSAEIDQIQSHIARHTQHRGVFELRNRLQDQLRSLRDQINTINTSRSRNPNKTKQPRSNVSGDDLQRYLDESQEQSKRRKRMGLDLLHYVSEACGCSRADIIDELGLETDDNCPHRGS
jgi:septal ring factor EnvC (AmiA/AmiB activator)